jgi:hypothetical protein
MALPPDTQEIHRPVRFLTRHHHPSGAWCSRYSHQRKRLSPVPRFGCWFSDQTLSVFTMTTASRSLARAQNCYVISTDKSALLWMYCREIAPFETPTFSKKSHTGAGG